MGEMVFMCGEREHAALIGDVVADTLGAAITRAAICWPSLTAANIAICPTPEVLPPVRTWRGSLLQYGHDDDERCQFCGHDAHTDNDRCPFLHDGTEQCTCSCTTPPTPPPAPEPPPSKPVARRANVQHTRPLEGPPHDDPYS